MQKSIHLPQWNMNNRWSNLKCPAVDYPVLSYAIWYAESMCSALDFTASQHRRIFPCICTCVKRRLTADQAVGGLISALLSLHRSAHICLWVDWPRLLRASQRIARPRSTDWHVGVYSCPHAKLNYNDRLERKFSLLRVISILLSNNFR